VTANRWSNMFFQDPFRCCLLDTYRVP
jgi:hypothetical protein